ncbi:MAG: GtrA family protein [Alphaproteobacteria bacterium]|nr:GtrA family protein [Alphaproteobacteria bacterium]
MSSLIYNILKKYMPEILSRNISEEMIRFIIWSLLCNVTAIVTYQLLLFFMNYKLSALFVYAIGFFLTFYSNAILVFNNSNINYKHGLKYILLYLFNCFIAYYGLIFLVSTISMNPRIGVIITTFLSAALSFILSKRIFKNSSN